MPDWWRLHAEPESIADVQVEIRMVQRGWMHHLKSQFGITFDPEEDGVHGTRIDLFWDHPYNHAVFLDGPHHDSLHQANLDELVTLALERWGITVQRIPYDPPTSKEEEKLVYGRICDEIEATLRLIESRRKRWLPVTPLLLETSRLRNGRSARECGRNRLKESCSAPTATSRSRPSCATTAGRTLGCQNF
jgi:hypothetical protein